MRRGHGGFSGFLVVTHRNRIRSFRAVDRLSLYFHSRWQILHFFVPSWFKANFLLPQNGQPSCRPMHSHLSTRCVILLLWRCLHDHERYYRAACFHGVRRGEDSGGELSPNLVPLCQLGPLPPWLSLQGWRDADMISFTAKAWGGHFDQPRVVPIGQETCLSASYHVGDDDEIDVDLVRLFHYLRPRYARAVLTLRVLMPPTTKDRTWLRSFEVTQSCLRALQNLGSKFLAVAVPSNPR